MILIFLYVAGFGLRWIARHCDVVTVPVVLWVVSAYERPTPTRIPGRLSQTWISQGVRCGGEPGSAR